MFRCQCPNEGKLLSHMAGWYDENTELPFTEHKPHACKCMNGLKRYICSDGITRVLCSICVQFGDVEKQS